jgi:hypothetical protein
MVFACVRLSGTGASAPNIRQSGGVAASVVRDGVGVYTLRLNCRAAYDPDDGPRAFAFAQLVAAGASVTGWTVGVSDVSDVPVSGTTVNVVSLYVADENGAAADLDQDQDLFVLLVLIGGNN